MSYDFSNRFRQDEEGVETYTFLGDERIWIEGYFGSYEVFFSENDEIQISCSSLQQAYKEAIVLNPVINPHKAL